MYRCDVHMQCNTNLFTVLPKVWDELIIEFITVLLGEASMDLSKNNFLQKANTVSFTNHNNRFFSGFAFFFFLSLGLALFSSRVILTVEPKVIVLINQNIVLFFQN